MFRGTFNCSVLFASNLYFEALAKIYDEKPVSKLQNSYFANRSAWIPAHSSFTSG